MMSHHLQAVGHDTTERDKERHEWWRNEFARESGGSEWTDELARALRLRLAEVKRNADDDSTAWELWQDLVDVLDEMEVVAARSKHSPYALKLPQPNVEWLKYFVAKFPPNDLKAGLRRNEDGEIVDSPLFPLGPKPSTRINDKKTDPVSRTTLILAMSGVFDRLSWALPKTPGATRGQMAKEYGGWNDKTLALASLLLGNRQDEPGPPEELLLRELESIRAMHRRQLTPTEQVRGSAKRTKRKRRRVP